MCCLVLRSKLQSPKSLSKLPPRDTGSSPSTILCLAKRKELGSRTASTGLLVEKLANRAPLISRVTLSTWTATDSSKFKIRTLWPSVRIGSRNLNSQLQSKLQTIARRTGTSLSTENGTSLFTTLMTLISICIRRPTPILHSPPMSLKRTRTQNLCNAQNPLQSPRRTCNLVTHKCRDTCTSVL